MSGHGFGHATRTGEVLRVLRSRAPQLKLVVSTLAPAFLFEGTVAPPLEVRPVAGDVGLAQRDALVIDEEGTVSAWRSFMASWEERVATEARWLEAAGARLVLGDVPPLAFAAAAAAGVPAVACTNFSWDWVYRHLAPRLPALAEAADWAAGAYRHAEGVLRLPFAGDLSVFRRIEDVPLVVRRPRVERAEARRRLGLDARPAALLSFGGLGVPGLRPAAFAGLVDFQLVLTGQAAPGEQPAHLRRLDASRLAAAGLDYTDLVGAVDVVVTKPGYGIVTDCIGARTRLVYTERGDFPEYPVMVAEMGRYLPAVHVANEALLGGRLRAALEQVLSLPFPEPPRTDGAAVAAGLLLERL